MEKNIFQNMTKEEAKKYLKTCFDNILKNTDETENEQSSKSD